MKVPRDGVVCLFSVRNDSSDRDIDYDEVGNTTIDYNYNVDMFAGCLGAGEGGGVPLHQPPPTAPPQPGGRHGQAGARAAQQVGEQKYLKIYLL